MRARTHDTSRRRPAALALAGCALLAALAGCGGVEYLLRPRRAATVWTRSSGEYVATTIGVYETARKALDQALADPGWSAALEQRGDASGLPPAVMLDLDETVLDNVAFQSMLDERNLEFDERLWSDWVREGHAALVPGASGFLAAAQARGVAVFYVTNRAADLEEATRANLAALGLPLEPAFDTLLTRGERPEWGSDKTSRRAHVARSHRVLLIVGDSLADFVSQEDGSAERRRAAAFAYEHMWGRRWFMLPNPIYGGWSSDIRPIRSPQQ
jgi:acid phosphatase